MASHVSASNLHSGRRGWGVGVSVTSAEVHRANPARLIGCDESVARSAVAEVPRGVEWLCFYEALCLPLALQKTATLRAWKKWSLLVVAKKGWIFVKCFPLDGV